MIDLDREVDLARSRIVHHGPFRALLWRGVLFDEDAANLPGAVDCTGTDVKVRRKSDGGVFTYCVFFRAIQTDTPWSRELIQWLHANLWRFKGNTAYDRVPWEIHEIPDPLAHVAALDVYLSICNHSTIGPG